MGNNGRFSIAPKEAHRGLCDGAILLNGDALTEIGTQDEVGASTLLRSQRGACDVSSVLGIHCRAGIQLSWSIPSDVKSKLINGYRIAYKDEGQGPAIVFIHGANADYRSFNSQIAALASSYRVITPSLRHYYPEQWNGEGSDFSVEQHAADVATLIRMLDLGKVHLVGWSRGGAVAIEIAKAHPDLVLTLVMEDGVIVMPVEETPEGRNATESRANNNRGNSGAPAGKRPEQGCRGACRRLGWPRLMATTSRAAQAGRPRQYLYCARRQDDLALDDL